MTPRLIESGDVLAVENPDTGESVPASRHAAAGRWTVMAVLQRDGRPMVVLEDLQDHRTGSILFVGREGVVLELPKTLEPMQVPQHALYRGHTRDEVVQAEHDMLGGEILSAPGDPEFADVAACLPPIRRVKSWWGEAPHTFVGSRDNLDAVPFNFTGSSERVVPALLSPEIQAAAQREDIWEGLVGGWLPAVRFSYPSGPGTWWDMVAFGVANPASPYIQPVWYRFLRLEGGRVTEAHYLDSYWSYPLRKEPEPERFYADLLELHGAWSAVLSGAAPDSVMQVEVPDAWITDLCRHALVREMITRVGDHPRYGVAERYYGGPEHDGFQDTFNSSVNGFLEWGLNNIARGYIEDYLTHFVREDGSLDYRGPEIAQYGRMLTCLAQYAEYTGDDALLVKHDRKIEALADVLMTRRLRARQLPGEDPSYGMIRGWDEADIYAATTHLHDVYEAPYLSNSAEAWRGFRDLGRVWQRIGQQQADRGLEDRGRRLLNEAHELQADFERSVARSILWTSNPPCVPCVAGNDRPYDVKAPRSSPENYSPARTYSEMLHSGVLPKRTVQMILDYCSAHDGIKLGLISSGSHLVGFTIYGQGYGLIQHDLAREFLLFYYTHIAHVHSRGTWTAFESADMDRDRAQHAPYCAPAQMTIPAVTKWMLVFEDPLSDTLWLAKAVPRAWLESGKNIRVRQAPTRWGRVSYSLASDAAARVVHADVSLPAGFEGSAKLRLRLPLPCKLTSVLIGSQPWEHYDAEEETVTLPTNTTGTISITIHYA